MRRFPAHVEEDTSTGRPAKTACILNRHHSDSTLELQTILALNAKEPAPFDLPITAYGRMCLAKAYQQEERLSEARRRVEYALALQPDVQGAKEMVDQRGRANDRRR